MLILKLHHAVAVLADQVVVLGFVEKIGVVVREVAAQVHLPQQTAFHEQTQRAVHGGPRNGAVDLADHLEQFLGIEMLMGRKGRVDNRLSLLRSAQTFAGKESVEALVDFGVNVGHERKIGHFMPLTIWNLIPGWHQAVLAGMLAAGNAALFESFSSPADRCGCRGDCMVALAALRAAAGEAPRCGGQAEAVRPRFYPAQPARDRHAAGGGAV